MLTTMMIKTITANNDDKVITNTKCKTNVNCRLPTWPYSIARGDTHRTGFYVSGREANRRHFRSVLDVLGKFQQCDIVDFVLELLHVKRVTYISQNVDGLPRRF